MKSFQDLYSIIIKLEGWAIAFKNGNEDYSFDIDTILHEYAEKYNLNLKDKPLVQIYLLLDFYCDAIKHRFKLIDTNYSTQEAAKDISEIKKGLEINDFKDLSLSNV